jgi:hypothetical protein
MQKDPYPWNTDELEASFDESGDCSGLGLNEPKRGRMRRKEKFQTKDFITRKKHKDRKRNLRNKIKYDFEL